jgi:hypothetical protein
VLIDFLQSLHGFELSCITVLAGVLVATYILRVTGISPGGILGTSFLLLAASDSIWWALVLLAVTPLIAWLYGRFFSRIYRGREPIFVMSLLSVIITASCGLILQRFHILPHTSFSFPLGVILPAILASGVRKQGIRQTYSHLLLSVALTFEAIVIIYGTGRWLGHDFNALELLAEPRQTLQLSWSSVFSVISVGIGFALYHWRGVKAAGFIVLPLLATLAIVSTINFALLMVIVAIVYAIVALLRRVTLVVGIGRMDDHLPHFAPYPALLTVYGHRFVRRLGGYRAR